MTINTYNTSFNYLSFRSAGGRQGLFDDTGWDFEDFEDEEIEEFYEEDEEE